MRWDAAIHGRLVIPAPQRKAWLAAELDWKSVEGSAVLKGYISGETVADIVDDVSFTEPSEFLTITWVGDELQLRSFVSQAGFTESMVGFAAAWAAGARFAGTGELVALGVGSRFGYRISVTPGHASVVKVVDEELQALAGQPDAVALREAITAMGGPMAAKLAAAASMPAAAPVVARVAPVVVEPPAAKKKPAAKKSAAKKKSR